MNQDQQREPNQTIEHLADDFTRLTVAQLCELQKHLGKRGIHLEIGLGEEIVEEVFIPTNPTNLQTHG